jgi:hypothetical protein
MWVRNPGSGEDGVFVSINTNLTPYILYSARQNDFSSIALVVNDTALSTLTNSLLTRRTCRRAHSPGTNQRAAAEGLSLCQQLAIGKYTIFAAARRGVRPAGWTGELLRADAEIRSA